MSKEINVKIWQAWMVIFLTIVSLIFGAGMGYATLKGEIETHIGNKDLHMPYEQKVKMFVPRKEFEGFESDTNRRLDQLQKSVDVIQNDIKKLLRR